MQKSSQNTIKKTIVQLSIVLFVSVFCFGTIIPVYAQVTDLDDAANTAALTQDVSQNAKETANEVKKEVGQKIKEQLLTAGLSGLVNAADYFMRKLAYDTAKYVASGGKGQSALVFQDGFGPYLKDAGDEAFGEIIEQFGGLTGLNLCSIPDVDLNVMITVNIAAIYDADSGAVPTANGCSWTEFRDGWSREAFQDRFEQIKDQGGQTLDGFVTGQFIQQSSLGQSDFGVALDAIGKVDRIVTEQRRSAELDRIEGKGFQAVRDIISGDILTPAALVEDEAGSLTANEKQKSAEKQITSLYGSEALQIFPQAASIFLNTLTTDVLDRLLSGGLIPSKSKTQNSSVANNPFAAPGTNNRQAASQAFNFLLTTNATRQIDAYDDDLIREFSSCPDNPGLYNCAIDTGFQQAIDRASNGNPITIQEALDAKPALLHPNWPLIPPDRAQDNQDDNCYQRAYCHSNIQKLRKARIVPLGFEIATALASPDTLGSVTLGDVVAGYNDCAQDAGGNLYRDDAHPYCHLIDPNWIIKMPPARCEAFGYDSIPVAPQVADRQESCSDISTCVAYDDTGQCISYGYCLQEKNTWQMPGQSCPAEYASCKTYIQESTGDTASYLSRTVDFGMCGPGNVGCLAYSLVRAENGNWQNSSLVDLTLKKVAGINQTIHFNTKITNPAYSCTAGDAGCTELDVANIFLDGEEVLSASRSGQSIALKMAPEYMSCYDADGDSSNGMQWPKTIAEAIRAQENNAACSDYAPACAPTEVGCNLWSPVNGGTDIPGKIGNNSCDVSCIGYDTFRQKESTFEPEIDQLHFIPANGEVCSVDYEGCSEFTNLSKDAGGEQLEYFKEIRYCERPTETNQKVFYSWEGSETEGFVLRVHELAQYTNEDSTLLGYYAGIFSSKPETYQELFQVNSPKYAARTIAELEELYATCNQDAYNIRIQNEFADGAAAVTCRELIDDEANTYYRHIDQIVSVSDSCVDLRKTKTQLSENETVTNSGACTELGGVWQDIDGDITAECSICRGGGTYKDGACVYSTIIEESVSCPAAANECRAYVGNTGGNVRRIQLGTFETDTTEEWNGATLSTESPYRGEHAIRIEGAATKQIAPNKFQTETTGNQAEVTNFAYEIRFWARGIPQQVDASLIATGGGTNTFGVVSIGDAWREYTLGPIAASDLDTTVTNTIQINGNNSANRQFFVDNIEIVRTTDYTYLIKNSWQEVVTVNGEPVRVDAPLACDSTPLDAFAGEALGCELYANANDTDQRRAVTGFASLCRSDAIGCTAVYDTQNNETQNEVWYNAKCDKNNTFVRASAEFVKMDGNTCRVSMYDGLQENGLVELGSCVIETGDEYCYIDAIELPNNPLVSERRDGVYSPLTFIDLGDNVINVYSDMYNALVSPSTIVVPADTAANSPIFLANQREYQCGSNALGCTAMGQELQTVAGTENDSNYSFNDVAYRILPDRFSGTDGVLCTADGVGCDAYQTDGAVDYFKDPSATGNSLCEYKAAVSIDGEQRSGWFKKDVGYCEGTENLCSTNDQCNDGVQCNVNEPVPCYGDFLSLDGEYGIWSNETVDKYEGFVGECAPEYNQCTEYVDRASGTDKTKANTYYVLQNEQLTGKIAECDGQAGLKDGCVLFDKTENPNKVSNTKNTYAQSELGAFELVAPVSDENNDANIILKVDRDRQCAEWLDCKSSRPETDENGVTRDVCITYDVCIEANEFGGCKRWAGNEKTGGYCSQDNTISCVENSECAAKNAGSCVVQKKLTPDVYTDRDTSWYGRDYSGYSIVDQQPYNNMRTVVFDMLDNYSEYLVYNISDNTIREAGSDNLTCTSDTGTKPDLASCGIVGEGRCYRGSCIAPLNGQFEPNVGGASPLVDASGDGNINSQDLVINDDNTNTSTVQQNLNAYRTAANALIQNGCKAPPEIDAPFPPSIFSKKGVPLTDTDQNSRYAYEGIGYERKSNFLRVNVFQKPEDGDVVSACAYTKISYGGATDYFPINNQDTPQGIILTGAEKGKPCVPPGVDDNLSSANSVCLPIDAKQTHIGMDGFCLQKDLGTPINGGDDYACVIWLPQQVSASRVDIYNSYSEAGYYPVPEFDAKNVVGKNENGGELYCLESTNFGGGGVVPEDYLLSNTNYKNSTLEDIKINGFIVGIDHNGAEGTIEAVNYRETNTADKNTAIKSSIESTVNDMFTQYNTVNLCGPSFYDYFIAGSNYFTDGDGVVRPTYSAACTNAYNNIMSELTDIGNEYYDNEGNLKSGKTESNYNAAIDASMSSFHNGSTAGDVYIVGNAGDLDDIIATANFSNYGGSIDGDCQNTYFRSDGNPILACQAKGEGGGGNNKDGKLAEERSGCRTGEHPTFRNGKYQEVVCSNKDGNVNGYTERSSALYTVMQTWAWDQIGLTAQVLRVEYNDEIESGGGDGNFGHSYKALYPQNASVNKREIEKKSKTTGVTSKSNYSTGIEEHITLNNLKFVYVVPLRIPGNFDRKFFPGIMVENFGINFAELREKNTLDEISVKESVSNIDPTKGPYEHFDKETEFPSRGGGDIGKQKNYKYDLEDGTTVRYVTFLYNSADINMLGSVPMVNADGSIENDPFEKICSDDGAKNWFAFAMDFDKVTGEFQQYVTDHCTKDNYNTSNPDDINESGMQVAVIADLYESCIEYGKVYDDGYFKNTVGNPFTNKAYTNRVWIEASNAFDIGIDGATRQTPAMPHGSLLAAGSNIESIVDQGYPFVDKKWGMPWWCSSEKYFGLATYFERSCTGLPSDTPKIVNKGAANIRNYFSFVEKYSNGVKNSTNSDDDRADGSNITKDAANRDLLPPQIYAVNPETCKVQSGSKIAEITGDDKETGSSGPCTAGPKDTFTLNGKVGRITGTDFDGDGLEDEDDKGNGVWDGIIGYGSLKVNMQFFAFADHDRMPIRNITVNFDDGETGIIGATKYGMYKNAKPLCTNSVVKECGASQLTCTDDADCIAAGLTENCTETIQEKNFGNQTRACTQDFYEFTYFYRCDSSVPTKGQPGVGSVDAGLTLAQRFPVSEINNTDVKTEVLARSGVTENTYVCWYRPKVRVTDNWGWCNATDNGNVQIQREGNNVCSDRSENLYTTFGSKVDGDRAVYVIDDATVSGR